LSHIIVNKIIPFDKDYTFSFREKGNKIIRSHPVWDFYFTLHNLQINLKINLKWLDWAWFFLSELSEELKIIENYEWSDIIEEKIVEDLLKIKENDHIILIDDVPVKNIEEWKNAIPEFYTENTKIQISMKLNLREYLILTNLLTPWLATSITIKLKK